MKRTAGIILFLCMLACGINFMACASYTAPLPETDDMDAAVSPAPTSTPLPTPKPTASPTLPPVMQQDWGSISDNGIDGVGSIRGNTNGNLNSYGRAVKTPDEVYYVDYFDESDSGVWGTKLCRYDLLTQKTETIFSLDYGVYFDIAYLNWYANKLWFVVENKDIFLYDPKTKALDCVFEGSEGARITRLILAYDIACVAVYGLHYQSDLFRGTLCLDAQTGEIVLSHPFFSVRSIMDGRLYGRRRITHDDGKSGSMFPDGSDLKECADFDFTADGKLYSWMRLKYENDEGQTVDGSAILITNVTDGSEQLCAVPEDFRFDGTYNASHNYLYLQEYWAVDPSAVCRFSLMDYSWLGRWGVKDYYWGVTLLDDEPAKWYASRCDLWFTENP